MARPESSAAQTLREVLELGWPLSSAEDEMEALRELLAENERLRAKLAEYDKYVGEFTRHA